MRDALTLGVRLPNSGPFATPEAILSTAELAEDLGYDTVWVHDHVSWPREKLTHFATGSVEACQDQDPNFFESITTAALLGGRLQSTRVGIAGLVLPLRDPRLLAKQMTTVERLTDSRLVFAVGIGAIPGDFEVMGVPFNRRGKITSDYLGALRAILGTEQPARYDGEWVSFTDGTFLPRPANLPIWVTGTSAAAVKRAAQYGDGWMTVYVTPETYRETACRVTEAVSGRPDSKRFDLGYETYVCVAESHDEAVRIASASLAGKFGTVEDGLRVCIVGDPDEAAQQLDAYRQAGAGHAELKFICHDLRQLADMMALTAERTVPALTR